MAELKLEKISTHLSERQASMLADAVVRLKMAVDAGRIPNPVFVNAKETINRAVSEAVTKFNTIHRHHMIFDVLVMGAWNLPAAHKEAVEANAEVRVDFIADMLPLHQLVQAAKPLVVKRGGPGSSAPAPRRRGAMTCQCCGRQVLAATGLIAHHGYRRPSDGWQSASCEGARTLPFEVSRARLGRLIEELRAEQVSEARHMDAVELEACPVVLVVPDRSKPNGADGRRPTRSVTVTRASFVEAQSAGDIDVWIPDFDSLKARDLKYRARGVDALTREIAEQSARFEGWRKTHEWNPVEGAWRALSQATAAEGCGLTNAGDEISSFPGTQSPST